MEVSSSKPARFGGAAAIGVAFGVYAVVSLGGGVALGGPSDLDTESGFGGGDGIAQKAVTGGFFGIDVADAAIQSNGKYVVAGTADGDFTVVRFNADGTVDNTFSGDGLATASFTPDASSSHENVFATSVAVDTTTSPEKIVVAGSRDDHTFDENDDIAVARFNGDGTLDTTFSADGKVATDISPHGEPGSNPANGSFDQAGDVAVLAGGKVLVGGGSTIFSPSGQRRVAFAQYEADGDPDPTFDTDGQAVANIPSNRQETVTRMVVGSTTITAALRGY